VPPSIRWRLSRLLPEVKENGGPAVCSVEVLVFMLGDISRSSTLEGKFFVILASGVNAGIGSRREGRLKLSENRKVVM